MALHDELFGHKGYSKKRKKRKSEEKKLSYVIASFLRSKYEGVEFRFDIAADIKLTMGQRVIIKNKLLHRRGYHDLTILEPRGGYCGLLIELKKDRSEVYNKDGTLRKKWNKKTQSDHNIEQMEHLEKMRKKGYKAEYGFGAEHTIALIDKYMVLEPTLTVNFMK